MLGVMAGQAAEHEHDHAQQSIGQACESVDECEEAVEEAPFADMVGIEAMERDAGVELKLLRFKLDSSTEKRFRTQ